MLPIIFYISASQEVDLLLAIGLPSNGTIDYVTGFDGFPAFKLTERANVRKPSRLFIKQLYSDFAILVTLSPSNSKGGYLFAVVNPAHTLIQFGLRIGPSGHSKTDITLYYTDYKTADSSEILAKFSVPNFIKQWTRFAVKVHGDEVTLYLNCRWYSQVEYVRLSKQLEFEEGSTLYVGQGGPTFPGKYEVSNHIFDAHFKPISKI